MANIGMLAFLGRGHLDPFAALGRHLTKRGHHVTIFHLTIAQAAVAAAGVKFRAIDVNESEVPMSARRSL